MSKILRIATCYWGLSYRVHFCSYKCWAGHAHWNNHYNWERFSFLSFHSAGPSVLVLCLHARFKASIFSRLPHNGSSLSIDGGSKFSTEPSSVCHELQDVGLLRNAEDREKGARSPRWIASVGLGRSVWRSGNSKRCATSVPWRIPLTSWWPWKSKSRKLFGRWRRWRRRANCVPRCFWAYKNHQESGRIPGWTRIIMMWEKSREHWDELILVAKLQHRVDKARKLTCAHIMHEVK